MIDDDSDGKAEADAVAKEVNDAIRSGDSLRISKYFEDILDELHTQPGSSFWSSPGATTAEAERLEREDLQFRGALAIKVTEALQGDRIKVTRITETEGRDGYRIEARDRQGRSYETTLTFGDALQAGACYGAHGIVDRMTGWIVEGIRGERDRYFRRMGS